MTIRYPQANSNNCKEVFQSIISLHWIFLFEQPPKTLQHIQQHLIQNFKRKGVSALLISVLPPTKHCPKS